MTDLSVTPAKPLSIRPPEMQDWANRTIYHPLAARLARALVPTGISPNTVSLSGVAVVAASAWCYTQLDWPISVLFGFLLNALWHVVDGADGDLARMTNRTSPAGELLDGVCDYVSYVILYLSLAWFMVPEWGMVWPWVFGWAGAIGQIVQNNFAESQKRTYLWRAYGVPWLQQARNKDADLFARRQGIFEVFVMLARGYIKMANAMKGGSAELDELVEHIAAQPGGQDRLATLARPIYARSLHYDHMLGTNSRTPLIALSMALGSPLWFFLFEATVMNVLLVHAIRHQRACDRAFLAALKQGA